jgi:hypothetical protein
LQTSFDETLIMIDSLRRVISIEGPLRRWENSFQGMPIPKDQRLHLESIEECLQKFVEWLTSFEKAAKEGKGLMARGLRMCKDVVKAGAGFDTSYDELDRLAQKLEKDFARLRGSETLDMSTNLRKMMNEQREQFKKVNEMLAGGLNRLGANEIQQIAQIYGVEAEHIRREVEDIKQEIREGNAELKGLVGELSEQAGQYHAENLAHQDANTDKLLEAVQKLGLKVDAMGFKGGGGGGAAAAIETVKPLQQQPPVFKGYCGNCGQPILYNQLRGKRLDDDGKPTEVYIHMVETVQDGEKVKIAGCPGSPGLDTVIIVPAAAAASSQASLLATAKNKGLFQKNIEEVAVSISCHANPMTLWPGHSWVLSTLWHCRGGGTE